MRHPAPAAPPGALAYTAWSEWYNVYPAGTWGYAASMPMLFGIALTPLLQWLILPPAMVAAYRTLVPVLFTGSKIKRGNRNGD